MNTALCLQPRWPTQGRGFWGHPCRNAGMLPGALPYAAGSTLTLEFVRRGTPARPVVVATTPVALQACRVVASGMPVQDAVNALLHRSAVFVSDYATGSLPGVLTQPDRPVPVVTTTGPTSCELPLPCGPQLHPGMTVAFCGAPGAPMPALTLVGTVVAPEPVGDDDLDGPPRPPAAYPVGRLLGRPESSTRALPCLQMQLPRGVVAAAVVTRPAGAHVAATVATAGPPVPWREAEVPSEVDVTVLTLARPTDATDTVTVTWPPGTSAGDVSAFVDVR
jgi:hypothetical protein